MTWRPVILAVGLTLTPLQSGFGQQADDLDPHSAPVRSYGLVSGEPGSLSHRIGVGLSTLIKLQVMANARLDLDLTASADDVASLRKVMSGEAQFAIVGSGAAAAAFNGEEDFADLQEGRRLSLAAALWDETVHVLAAEDHAGSGRISDLGGLVGDLEFGGADARRAMRALLGPTDSPFVPIGLDLSDDLGVTDRGLTSSEWKAEAIAGLVVKEPFPSANVRDFLLASGRAFRFLGLTSEEADGLADGWRTATLPAGAYPGLDREVVAATETMLLVADAETANDAVYEITRAIFDNLLFLANFHEVAERIEIDRALQGSALPLHPGAGRYYHDVGLLTETVTAATGSAAASGPAPEADVVTTRSLAGPRAVRKQPIVKGEGAAIFNFYFDLGATELSPGEIAKLRNVAREIRGRRGVARTEPQVTVVGATYAAGSRETYQEIAVRRARAVEAALIAEGVPPSSIAIAEKEQILSGQTIGYADQSQMRRVEVQVETPAS